MAKEEKGLELTIPLPATEDKSMLDRIREGASYYDKKITDAINYVTPPELRPILRGLEQIAPFQNLPKYDFNKSFTENIINMATDTGILGLDLATFGIGSASPKIALKAAKEITESGAKKTGVKKIDEIIEDGVKKTTRGPQRRNTIQLKIENYLKGMDKNEVIKMTEDQLVDLLEKRLNVPVSKGSIGRARRELGLTSGQAGLSGKAVIMKNALDELGEAKKSMSLEDIVKYLKENNDINTTKDALRKILKPGSYYVKKDIAVKKDKDAIKINEI